MSVSRNATLTIDEMFKKQQSGKVGRMQIQVIECPACSAKLPKDKLNMHLDKICPSKNETELKSSNVFNYKKDFSVKQEKSVPNIKSTLSNNAFKMKEKTLSRLSLKRSLISSSKTEFKKSKNNIDDNCALSKKNEANAYSLQKVTNDKIGVNHVCTHKNAHLEYNHPSFPQPMNVKISNNSCSDINKVQMVDVDAETASIDGTLPVTLDDETSPYYLTNFKCIMDTILRNEDDCKLFNKEDELQIHLFQCASESAQKLYVRLFQRKHKWLRPHKINYSEIGSNLDPVLHELVQCKLLLSGEHIEDLKTALNLLSVNEIKNIGKMFNLNVIGKGKNEMVDLILKHSHQQKSVFGSSVSGDMVNIIMKRVIQAVGSCFKLSSESRSVFVRIMLLFFLPFSRDDESDSSGGFQQQLFTLFLIKMGRLEFPEFKVMKQAVLFRDRKDLIQYEESRQLENDINRASELKNFELALKLFHSAREKYDDNFQSHAKRDSALPQFLRHLTKGHVYIRCLNQGVDVLQKLKRFDEAVALLQELLKQMVYCQDYRGHWWDRLALNLDRHLNEQEKSLSVIHEGVADPQVRTGHRHALFSRAHHLCNSLSKKKAKSLLVNLEFPTIKEAPKVIIKGCLLPHPLPHRKNVFISKPEMSDDSNTVTLLEVEELALAHYKANNFTEGIHGEGATFVSLFGLMFWDIIYGGQMPDVFRSPYQSYPLDLMTDHFYAARENDIISRLNFIRNSTMKDLEEFVEKIWESEKGKLSLVSWDKFSGYLQVQGLIKCFKQHILVGICERLAKDFRHSRSGVPDLVVWNPLNETLKIVEVKGPGDHLSSKQILWLDYLLNIGASVEVCHVEGVSSKKLAR